MKDSGRIVYSDDFHSERVVCINFAFNKRNTFNLENIELLMSVFEQVLNAGSTRCIIFRSVTPNYFSDGFSLKEMFGENVRGKLQDGNIQTYERIVSAYERIIKCPIPTISFVEGICRGGGFELGLACDFIVATPNSKFALHEVKIGIVPGLGGFGMMKDKSNLSIANYHLLTGDYLSSTQATNGGLVDAEVDGFEEMLEHFVSPICRRTRVSLIRTKSFINLQKTKEFALYESRIPFLDSLKDAAKIKSDQVKQAQTKIQK
jgi:enoyl-CoA hydratase/carnithine racemase